MTGVVMSSPDHPVMNMFQPPLSGGALLALHEGAPVHHRQIDLHPQLQHQIHRHAALSILRDLIADMRMIRST